MRVERRRDLGSCTSNWRREPLSPDEQFERLLNRLMVSNAAERAGRTGCPQAGVNQVALASDATKDAGRVAVGAAPSHHRLPPC